MATLIGTAPNQVPVNGLLGTGAFIDARVQSAYDRSRANHTGTQDASTVLLAGVGLDSALPALSTVDRDRANHTGTQEISTVSGLQTALNGKQASGDYMTRTGGQITTGKYMESTSPPNIANIATSGNTDNVALTIGNGSNNGASAVIQFHRQGTFRGYLGLDIDNQLRYGGGSNGVVSHLIWHAGNLINPVSKEFCYHNSAVLEFGSVAQTIDNTIDAPNPYVMVGLRTVNGDANRINARGVALRNYQ